MASCVEPAGARPAQRRGMRLRVCRWRARNTCAPEGPPSALRPLPPGHYALKKNGKDKHVQLQVGGMEWCGCDTVRVAAGWAHGAVKWVVGEVQAQNGVHQHLVHPTCTRGVCAPGASQRGQALGRWAEAAQQVANKTKLNGVQEAAPLQPRRVHAAGARAGQAGRQFIISGHAPEDGDAMQIREGGGVILLLG
jgi:hypothetical protein